MDEKIFQVGSADTLATIAEKYLGSVSNFRELATFNNIDILSQITGSTLKIPSNIRKIISVNAYKLMTTDTGIISMLDPKNNVLGIIGSWNGKVFDSSTQTLIN